MSVNWVMLSDKDGFVLLNQERRLWSSPLRTSLAVNSLSKYPGREPYALTHATGTLYLTNRRIIYLPQPRTATFQSFAAPLERIQDSHVSAPWIGANAWVALCQPVAGGGIPTRVPAVELKLTFNDGGAFDFHAAFERTKERLLQALEVARANGLDAEGDRSSGQSGGRAGQAGANLASVDLEDLPAYEGPGPGYIDQTDATRNVASGIGSSSGTVLLQASAEPTGSTATQPVATAAAAAAAASQSHTTPAEPPPGYEEVQRETVEEAAEALEQGLRFRGPRRIEGSESDDDGIVDRDRDGSLI